MAGLEEEARVAAAVLGECQRQGDAWDLLADEAEVAIAALETNGAKVTKGAGGGAGHSRRGLAGRCPFAQPLCSE